MDNNVNGYCFVLYSCILCITKACLLDDGVSVSTAVCFTYPPLIYCSGNHRKTLPLSRCLGEQGEVGRHTTESALRLAASSC